MDDYTQPDSGLLPDSMKTLSMGAPQTPGAVAYAPALAGASLGVSASAVAPSGTGLSDDQIKSRVVGKIYSGEGPGYDALYGGGKFKDYSKFPDASQGWNGVQLKDGSWTHAAGAPQFQPGTWKKVSSALGLNDFSPASQDKGTWYWADKTYKKETGRDLLSDARANTVQWKALGGEWPSLLKEKTTDLGSAKLPTTGGGKAGAPPVEPDQSQPVAQTQQDQGAQTGVNANTLKTLMLLQAFAPHLQFTPVTYDPYAIQKLGQTSG